MRKMNDLAKKTAEIAEEIKALRAKSDITAEVAARIVELRSILLMLCPACRFVWRNGRPIIDLVAELAKMEAEGIHGNGRKYFC